MSGDDEYTQSSKEQQPLTPEANGPPPEVDGLLPEVEGPLPEDDGLPTPRSKRRQIFQDSMFLNEAKSSGQKSIDDDNKCSEVLEKSGWKPFDETYNKLK